MATDEPKVKARHDIHKVDGRFDINPTAYSDMVNAGLPEQHQFPEGPPPARYIYDDGTFSDLEADSSAYDYSAAHGPGELLRCSREKNPQLADAQRFFDGARERMKWVLERPIFRTARFWVKHIWS